MSTQKNEHNPDNLNRKQVGEGWRILGPDERQQHGDEWWNDATNQWEANHEKDIGRRVYGDGTWYITYRRRITPPTDTTGSGREGETAGWGIEETSENLWIGTMRADGKVNEIVCNFHLVGLTSAGVARKRQLANIIVQAVNQAGPQSNTIRELESQVEALRRTIQSVIDSAVDPTNAQFASMVSLAPLRSAIDSAQRQEAE